MDAAKKAIGGDEGKSGFTGQLDQFQLVDIIQMCCLGRRTGKLIINHGERRGFVYLDNGTIVHAECEGFDGDDAAKSIIEAQDRKVAALSGRTPLAIKSLTRSLGR